MSQGGQLELLPGTELWRIQLELSPADGQSSARACLLQQGEFGASRAWTDSQGSCGFGDRMAQAEHNSSAPQGTEKADVLLLSVPAKSTGASGNAACLSQAGKHRPRDAQNEKKRCCKFSQSSNAHNRPSCVSQKSPRQQEALELVGLCGFTPQPKAHRHSMLGNLNQQLSLCLLPPTPAGNSLSKTTLVKSYQNSG